MVKKTIKKFIAIIIALIVIVSASLLVYNLTNNNTSKKNQNSLTGQATAGLNDEDNNEITVGVITPLTGFTAESGQNVKKGLELGKEYVQENYDVEVNLVYEDGQCLGREAVSAYNKLNLNKDIDVITGFVCSSELIPVAPLVEGSNKVILGTTASSPLISDLGDNIYRVAPSDRNDALLHFKYLQEQNLEDKNVGLVYINNDYGIGIKEVLEQQFNEDGYDSSYYAFNFGDSDYRTFFSKLKNDDVEVIVFVGYPENVIPFLKQSIETNTKVPILGSWATLSDKLFLEENKNLVDNFYVTNYDTNLGEETSFFKEMYVEKYNEQPVVYSDFAFDSVVTVVEAYVQNGEISKETFGNTYVEQAATGYSISFDENGDRLGLKPSLFQVEDNELVCAFNCN